MRRVRDRYLPEPFRMWIDRAVPLPPRVTILPRDVSVGHGVMAVAFALMGCAGIGLPLPLVARGALADAGD